MEHMGTCLTTTDGLQDSFPSYNYMLWEAYDDVIGKLLLTAQKFSPKNKFRGM
jgi:hypothetical protein